MTIRHFTASGIVFDDAGRVLLAHSLKHQVWLYPGGHVEENEDPAQAVVREVREETGIEDEIVSEVRFAHPAVATHPNPWVVLEMESSDHKHIDLVYVLQATGGDLVAQLAEVSAVRWVPVYEVGRLDIAPELPSLIAEAAAWVKGR